jgi:hypothetical protein
MQQGYNGKAVKPAPEMTNRISDSMTVRTFELLLPP